MLCYFCCLFQLHWDAQVLVRMYVLDIFRVASVINFNKLAKRSSSCHTEWYFYCHISISNTDFVEHKHHCTHLCFEQRHKFCIFGATFKVTHWRCDLSCDCPYLTGNQPSAGLVDVSGCGCGRGNGSVYMYECDSNSLTIIACSSCWQAMENLSDCNSGRNFHCIICMCVCVFSAKGVRQLHSQAIMLDYPNILQDNAGVGGKLMIENLQSSQNFLLMSHTQFPALTFASADFPARFRTPLIQVRSFHLYT